MFFQNHSAKSIYSRRAKTSTQGSDKKRYSCFSIISRGGFTPKKWRTNPKWRAQVDDLEAVVCEQMNVEKMSKLGIGMLAVWIQSYHSAYNLGAPKQNCSKKMEQEWLRLSCDRIAIKYEVLFTTTMRTVLSVNWRNLRKSAEYAHLARTISCGRWSRI